MSTVDCLQSAKIQHITERGTVNEIMTTKEASEILGITQESVARLLRKGILEGQHFGRDWMVFRESVEAYKRHTEGLAKNDPKRGQIED